MVNTDLDSTVQQGLRTTVLDRLGGLGIFTVLGVAVLGSAAGGPEWPVAWHHTAVLLLVTIAVILVQFLVLASVPISRLERYRVAVLLVLLFGLLGVAYQSRSPGYGVGLGRTASAVLVFGALAAVCVLVCDPREYLPIQWVVIGGVLIVVGLFFYHSVSVAAVSLRSRHPIWGGFVMAVGLLVLPQYVLRRQFLWAVTRISALLVVLALPVYVVGEYTLFGLSFGLHDAYTIPVLDFEVPATRSLFVNRNAFGVVVFAGLVTAVAEVYRSYIRKDSTLPMIISTALLLINGVGLALSFGRAMWVITPMALGVYLTYIVFGPRSVPIAVVGGFVYLVGGIAAVHIGLLPLPVDTPTRANRWYPAARAVLDKPSLLGAGLVNPGQYIAPYHPTGSADSPHNSYLTMAIRAGWLWVFAYIILIAASLLRGLLETNDIEAETHIGLLALGVGFAAHQLFEAYTLFNWDSSTVFAVFVFGFLVFGRPESPVESTRRVIVL